LDIGADVFLADGGKDLTHGHVPGDGVVGGGGDDKGYGVSTVVGELLLVGGDGHVTKLDELVEIIGAQYRNEFLIHLLAKFTILVIEKDETERLNRAIHVRTRSKSLRDELVVNGTGRGGDGFIGSGKERANKFVVRTLGHKEIGGAVRTVRALDVVVLVPVPIMGQSIVSEHIPLLQNDRKVHARDGGRQLLSKQGIVVAGCAVIGIRRCEVVVILRGGIGRHCFILLEKKKSFFS